MAHPDDERMVDGHIDEGTVHAWLDGQLLAADAARVESHVATCGVCAAQVAEARGFVAASSRILSALDGVPARVVPERRRRVQLWHVRAAAAVVIVALGTVTVLHNARSPALSVGRVPELSDTVRPVAPAPAAKEEDKPAAPPAASSLTTAPSHERVSREGARASALSKSAQRVAEPSTQGSSRDEAYLQSGAHSELDNKIQTEKRVAAAPTAAAPSSAPSVMASGAAGATGGAVHQPTPAPTAAEAVPSPIARAKSARPQGMRGDYERSADSATDSLAVPHNAQKMLVAAPAGAERDIVGRVGDAQRKGVAAQSALGRSRAGVPNACVAQTVMIPSSVAAGHENASLAAVRLDSVRSTDGLYPGYALRAPSDSAPAPAGAWVPLGPDSAIVSVPYGGRGVSRERTDSADRDALHDRRIVQIRVRCPAR